MKLVTLVNFDELALDLKEFPEFLPLAKQEGLNNFADAIKANDNLSARSKKDLLKLILAKFILWLGMASVGDYKVLVGKKYWFFNHYESMLILVPGGRLEMYRQAKNYYQSALRVKKGLRP